MTKQCTRCKEYLPADIVNFPVDARNNDGLSSHCKKCNKEQVMTTRAKYLGLTLLEYKQQIEEKKLKREADIKRKAEYLEAKWQETVRKREETQENKRRRQEINNKLKAQKFQEREDKLKAQQEAKLAAKKMDNYFKGSLV